MKQDPTNEGRFSLNGRGLGTVTEEMVRARASEIAVINGRGQHNLIEADLEQALRELQGEERLNPPATAAEKIPEDDRWGTTQDSGHKAETLAASDEQTFAEKLVEEGVADAEHDQEVQATKQSLRREKRRPE